MGDVLQIEETGGQRRVLALSGPALPHAGGFSFRDRTLLVTEHYGVDCDQTVLGEELGPTSMTGSWTIQTLNNRGPHAMFAGAPLKAAESLALAFAALRQAGEVLRVTWGPWQRYGRIEETEFTPGRYGRLEWRVDFVWTAKQDVQLFVPRLPTPDEGLTGFAAAIEAALQGIDWAEGMMAAGFTALNDFLDVYVRGPLDVLNAGGALLGRATQAVEATLQTMMEVAQAYVDGVTSYKDAVMRLGELGCVLAAESFAMQDACGRLTGDSFAPADDPAMSIEAQQHVGGLAEVTSALLAQSGKHVAAAQALAQTQQPQLRVHVARDGESLRDLAHQYYSDRERWPEIAVHNGLRTPVLWAGQEVVIP